MQSEPAGRRALVCASTSGLGLACAQALAGDGARVAIVGRRGDLAREEAARLGPDAIGLEADLTSSDATQRIIDAVREAFGGIDVLVLNSGGPPPGTALQTSDEELELALAMILKPALRTIRAIVPEMQARGWGRVVAIGSSGVEQPIRGLAASNAARAGLAALLKTLASEVAADGVTVNTVLPGRLRTERVQALDRHRAEQQGISIEEAAQETIANIPVGRYGDPMELGRVVSFLASDAASYVTGCLVRVDGGMISTTT